MITRPDGRKSYYLILDDPTEYQATVIEPETFSPTTLGEWSLAVAIKAPSQHLLDSISAVWFAGTLINVEFLHKGKQKRGCGWITSVDIIGPRTPVNDIDTGVDMSFVFQGTKELTEVT